MLKTISLLLLMLVLNACGEPQQTANSAAPEKPSQRVMEEQFQALDKARGVEKSLQEAAEKQRKAIEEQGG
ncbi:MAG: hypothetical protein L3J22_00800 [Xanthomonadales bacterium]|nr:hypothetical protein [Xanthomonadales bacterium]